MASAVLPARPPVQHRLRHANSLSPLPSPPVQSLRMRPAAVRPVSAIASFQDFAGRNSSSSSSSSGSKGEEDQGEQQAKDFLRGGEDVADIMTQMAALLEDIQGFEEREEEALAVEMAAAAAVAGRLEVLDRSFMLALDYMLQEASKQKDSQQVWLLGLLKKQVLLQLESKFPPQVEVLSMLVTTPRKETRLDILRRSVAAASLGANRAQLEAQVAAQKDSTEKGEGSSAVANARSSTSSRSLGDMGASGSSSSSVQGADSLSSFPDAPIPVSERSGPQGLAPPSQSSSGPQRPAEVANQRRLQSGGPPGWPPQRGFGGGRGDREEEEGEGEEDKDSAARGPAAVWEEYAPEEAWDLDRGSEGESEGERKRKKVKRRVPAAPLQNIVAQADDIVAFMEDNLPIRDRRLLARLLLAREEARGMMSGGYMDPRNDVRGLQNLPEAEVRFISALVAIRPEQELRARIMEVMKGGAEGEYKTQGENGQPSVGMPWGAPVRPGQFVDSVTKVIVGVYKTGGSGVVVQQLERIRTVTLEVFQQMGFS